MKKDLATGPIYDNVQENQRKDGSLVIEDDSEYATIRCGTCHKLLARGSLKEGYIELFCPRCKRTLALRAHSTPLRNSIPNLAPATEAISAADAIGESHVPSQSEE